MKHSIYIVLVSILVIISCKEKTETSTEISPIKSQKEIISTVKERTKDSIVITYFPKEKDTFKLDTLISKNNIRIVLIDTYIPDSYVIDSFEVEKGLVYEHRYRNAKTDVQIFKDEKKLVDTSFVKESFLNETNKELIKAGNLHGIWIKKVNNNIIDFFGSICKPDTDWCYDFYHTYDLNEDKFVTKEYIDPEE